MEENKTLLLHHDMYNNEKYEIIRKRQSNAIIAAIYFCFLVSYSILIYLLFGDHKNYQLPTGDVTTKMAEEIEKKCWENDAICRRDTGLDR